jgi:hypothetical protein
MVTKKAPRIRLRAPDFLGIGAQKAGTTWLYANLRRHPGLWLPPVKELHYFDEVHIPQYRKWTTEQRERRCGVLLDKYKSKLPEAQWNPRYLNRIADIAASAANDEAYCKVFGRVPARRLCGEVTPEYSILPDEGIAHIMRLVPSVRIILLLRDPIERNWSHARMMAEKRGMTNDEQLKRLALGKEATARADYPGIIDRWARYVSADQMLIVFMDDIVARPFSVIEQVCAHLGVECEESYFPEIRNSVHAGSPLSIPETIYTAMREQLRPVYRNIATRFPDVGTAWEARHYA